MKNNGIKSLILLIFTYIFLSCNNNEEIIKENQELKNQIKSLEESNSKFEEQSTIDTTSETITEEKIKEEVVVSKPKKSVNSKPKTNKVEPKKEIIKEVKTEKEKEVEKIQNKFGEVQKSPEQLKKDIQEQEQKVKSKFGN